MTIAAATATSIHPSNPHFEAIAAAIVDSPSWAA
nr:MAG TPA: hypothetical protein [Bacteriophage sp.]